MDVVLEVFYRRCVGQYLPHEVLVVVDNLVQGEWLEVRACLQIKELAERESSKVVAIHYAVELGVFLFQSHDAASREHYFQVRVEVVALSQFGTPVRLLEHLVNEQHLAAFLVELACEVGYSSVLKIEVVHVDIQTLSVAYIKMLFGVLQKEGGLSDATCPLDTNHSVVPVYVVHKLPTHRCIGMFYQIGVCAEKSFHRI